jgi:hypothetical protein
VNFELCFLFKLYCGCQIAVLLIHMNLLVYFFYRPMGTRLAYLDFGKLIFWLAMILLGKNWHPTTNDALHFTHLHHLIILRACLDSPD